MNEKKAIRELNKMAFRILGTPVNSREQCEYHCEKCNSNIPYKNYAKIAKHLQQHNQMEKQEREQKEAVE